MQPKASLALKILVLDDNRQAWLVHRDSLQEQGLLLYLPNESSSQLWDDQESIPDLIVVHVDYEDGHGFDVCSRLRTQDSTKETPLLMMSASRSLEERTLAFEAGASDFMHKPFPLEEFVARARYHCKNAEVREKLRLTNLSLEDKVRERTHELELSNQALFILNRKLDSMAKLKNRFLEMISHELRTPLNGVFGAIDLFRSEHEGQWDPELQEIYETSKHRLENLILDSLMLGQIESRVKMGKRYEVDLLQALAEAGFEEVHRRPQDDCSEARMISLVPSDLFILALRKLAEIVKKYDPDDNTVWSCALVDDQVQLKVCIPGAEIPEHRVSAFFDPFEISDHNSGVGNLGLRPVLVGEVVAIAGGNIQAFNAVGPGLVFELRLPLGLTGF